MQSYFNAIENLMTPVEIKSRDLSIYDDQGKTTVHDWEFEKNYPKGSIIITIKSKDSSFDNLAEFGLTNDFLIERIFVMVQRDFYEKEEARK